MQGDGWETCGERHSSGIFTVRINDDIVKQTKQKHGEIGGTVRKRKIAIFASQ